MDTQKTPAGTITREYHVPQLGKISATLFPYATQTYNLLNRFGHIKRLRDIDQLGVIRNVYEGAHHSRWEYVMLQLSVIYRLCVERDENDVKFAKGLGMSSTMELSGRNPTGGDILQMWTLLFNAGHLPGTFASERGLLRYFAKHADLRQSVYHGLPKQKRWYFKQVLEREDIYALHKVLISFHLERYRRFSVGKSGFIEFLQRLTDLYLRDDPDHREKQHNLKALFHKIRQISYLFLDFQYGPIPVDFDLGAIFLNLEDYVSLLFKEPDSPIARALDGFENLLSINMYHSAESIRELGFHTKRIEQKIEENKGRLGLRRTSALHSYLLKSYQEFEPQATQWAGAFNIHLLFDAPPIIIELLKKTMDCDAEKELNKRYGRTCCLLTCQAAPTRRQFAVTLSFHPHSNVQSNTRAIGRFLKDLVRLDQKLKAEDEVKLYTLHNLVDNIFQRPYREMVVSILGYITCPGLYFEFKPDNLLIWRRLLAVRGSKSAAQIIEKICEKEEHSDARVFELATLRRALLHLGHPSGLILCLSRLLVYDKDRKPVTDVDSMGLGFKNGQLGILLVEAKDQKRGGGTDSQKQLNEALTRLQFNTSVDPSLKRIEGGAYCYLPIDGCTRLQ